MRTLVIAERNGSLRTFDLPREPEKLAYDGEDYKVKQRPFSDFNYLRNRANELVGFQLDTLPFTEKSSPFFGSGLAGLSRIDPESQVVYFCLTECEYCEVQEVGGFGDALLVSKSGRCMLAIPEWLPWGILKFPVAPSGLVEVFEWAV